MPSIYDNADISKTVDVEGIYAVYFNDRYANITRYLFVVGEEEAISFANNPHCKNSKVFHVLLGENGLIMPDEERPVCLKEKNVVNFYDHIKDKRPSLRKRDMRKPSNE